MQKLRVYSDASHADRASQGRFIVFTERNGRVSPIVWRSKKLESYQVTTCIQNNGACRSSRCRIFGGCKYAKHIRLEDKSGYDWSLGSGWTEGDQYCVGGRETATCWWSDKMWCASYFTGESPWIRASSVNLVNLRNINIVNIVFWFKRSDDEHVAAAIYTKLRFWEFYM